MKTPKSKHQTPILLRLLVLATAFSLSARAEDTIKTNLPATIITVVSTNVVSSDNSSGCNLCFDNQGHWNGSIPAVWPPPNCQPYKAATERWTITNVIRRVTLTTQWQGKDLTYSEETVLSSVTNRQRLHVEWKKED